MAVEQLPERVEAARRSAVLTPATEERLQALVWSCFIGDATQVGLGTGVAVFEGGGGYGCSAVTCAGIFKRDGGLGHGLRGGGGGDGTDIVSVCL